MSIPKPHFELARVYEDGTRETEIVSVVRLPWDTKMDRRGFLGAGATAGAVLGALTAACAPEDDARTNDAKASNNVLGDCGGLTAHSNAVQALAISPDGKLLVSGSSDKTIKLWGLPAGALRKTLPQNSVGALAISPDGKLLASGSFDDTIKLWGLPDGALRKTLEQNAVGALAISPDGKLLVSGSSDKTIKLWGLPEGALRRTLDEDKKPVSALAISPDGRLLASGGFDYTFGHIIKLWSLPDGLWLKTLVGHASPVIALAISPDGKHLASGSEDKTIKLWDLPQAALNKTLEGHKDSVRTLAISRDGKLVASGSNDKTIKLWDLPQGGLRKTLEGHKGGIAALAISPDGKLVASGGGDNTIMLWGLPDGESRTCLVDLKATPQSAQGVVYQHKNENGQVVTYTGPCGSAIPPGAVCTCNCVPGSYSPPAPTPVAPSSSGGSSVAPSGGGGSYSYCTCNKVCTCIPVRCQAHRVLHEEPVVRTMAEELLLLMGTREFEYMSWAAGKAEPALQARIHEIMEGIEAGALPNPDRWPTLDECIARLDDPDDVIALMAAQMLAQKTIRHGLRLDDELSRRVNELIRAANERSPFPRHCPKCAD